jgi:hypothetical protein
MKDENLQTWEDFESKIIDLQSISPKAEGVLRPSTIVFRGQSDAKWHLTTTVERYMGNNIALIDYYTLIYKAKSRIETFTGRIWDIPALQEYKDWLANYDSMGGSDRIEALEYMAYIRHQGFPSPLLDWSTSPYVAAYFAFRGLASAASNVAIFAFIEHYGIKGGRIDEPNIWTLNTYLSSDKRHFLQQSQYTICTSGSGVKAQYGNHEEVFARGRKNQDLLWKFTLPASEREKVLRKLDLYNINSYSLFGSEESLMETVFIREFLQK